MAKIGRPTKYLAKYCDEVKAFLGKGFSLTAFAASIGTHRQTLYEWENTHPEFSDAIKTARALSVWHWEKENLRLAAGGQGNASNVIFSLKNRGKDEWSDTVEHTGKDGGGIIFELVQYGPQLPEGEVWKAKPRDQQKYDA